MLVDVDSHVSTGARPDLLVLFAGTSSPKTVYVIEAKGNSQGRRNSIKQPRSGIDQVLAAPGASTRLVAGITLPQRDLDVFAVSVPAAGGGGRPEQAWLETLDAGIPPEAVSRE